MKRTILLADDSPTIRRLVTQTFAGGNFQIVEVSNGEAAIKQLEELNPQPSIVLADIYMPGKNGYEVCAYVRNHKRFRETPVVLLVGLTSMMASAIRLPPLTLSGRRPAAIASAAVFLSQTIKRILPLGMR